MQKLGLKIFIKLLVHKIIILFLILIKNVVVKGIKIRFQDLLVVITLLKIKFIYRNILQSGIWYCYKLPIDN